MIAIPAKTSSGPNVIRRMTAAFPLPLLLRFAAGGLLNTAFGYVIFLSALTLGANLFGALVMSTLAGIFFNFQTSRRLVFQSKERGLLVRFGLVYVALLATNYGSVLVLRELGIPNWCAQAVLVLPIALAAFFAQRYYVFRPREVAS